MLVVLSLHSNSPINGHAALLLYPKKAFKGNAYRKAADAIKDISFEITEDNAMGFSNGKIKTKIIGKPSDFFLIYKVIN